MKNLNVKYILTGLVLLVVVFLAGRMSVHPEPQKSISEDTNSTKETHKETNIIERPDGTKETKIVEDTTSNKSTTKDSIITPSVDYKQHLNVSLLAAYDPNELKPVYGINVTKEVLRPLTIGVFALTNKTVGLSVGINFD